MGFGHGPFGHFAFGHSATVARRLKGFFVLGFKAVLDLNKPAIPRGFKAVRL